MSINYGQLGSPRCTVRSASGKSRHTCWAASTVETVAAILQMQKGMLHPSINIEDIDPEIDLDVCNGTPVKHQINLMMKNSFGFGGLNSISLIKRFDGE